MFEISSFIERCKIEEMQDWRGWIKQIPFISFPVEVEWKPIPPFCGAVARFIARKKGSIEEVSAYLDCYDVLGLFGSPYWEIYPYREDTYRCAIGEIDDLVSKICEQLGIKQ